MAEPFLPTAPLTATLDIKSPESYLALGPTRALARDLGIEVDWLPVVTAPPRPAPEGNDRGSRHKQHRATYRARDLARYAKVAGLTLFDPERNPDSTLAGMAMLAAKGHSTSALHAFLDAAFERYWKAELNLEDPEALAALLRGSGVDGFSRDADAFESLQASLATAGLYDAPGYLIEEDVFLGRAHLPMIRWILEGRVGPGPI